MDFNFNNNMKLLDIYNNTDQVIRERYLNCFSNEQISNFGKSLVSEIVAQSIPLETNTQINFIDYALLKSSNNIASIESTEGIRMITTWLKNRRIFYQDVMISKEYQSAFFLLVYEHSSDNQFNIASDFLQTILAFIDIKSNEYDINLFYNLSQLEILFQSNLSVEKSKSLCKLFTAFGEKTIQYDCLYQYTSRIIEIIVKCGESKALIEITYAFWRRLATKPVNRQKFEVHIEEFIKRMAKHCIHENLAMEIDCSLSDLQKFRDNAALVIKDIMPIINCQKVFEYYLFKIQHSQLSFKEVEVCLFTIDCIAKNISVADNVNVSNFIDDILKLDERSNSEIVCMSINILKKLSNWINVHHQAYLMKVFNFLLKFINKNGAIASPSVITLSEICIESRIHLTTRLDILFEIVKNLESFSLTTDAEISIFTGIALVISNLQNERELYVATKYLFDIQYEKIQYERKARDSEPLRYLNQLAEIYYSLQPVMKLNENNNPIAIIFMENLPKLSHMLNYYQTNEEIFKVVIKCLRYAIPKIGIAVLSILDALIKQTLYLFCEKKHSCILYLFEVLISNIGNDQRCVEGLLIAFHGLSVTTFDALNIVNETNVQIFNEYFLLSTTCINKMPMKLIKSPLILKIIDLSIESCKFNAKDANKSAMKFLACILTCNFNDCALQAMTFYSNIIISTLVQSSAFVFDLTLITDVVDVFFILKTQSQAGFSTLFNNAVMRMPKRSFSGNYLCDTKINAFINFMTKSNVSKIQMINSLTTFAKTYRL